MKERLTYAIVPLAFLYTAWRFEMAGAVMSGAFCLAAAAIIGILSI